MEFVLPPVKGVSTLAGSWGPPNTASFTLYTRIRGAGPPCKQLLVKTQVCLGVPWAGLRRGGRQRSPASPTRVGFPVSIKVMWTPRSSR